jgi:hypothetical protein
VRSLDERVNRGGAAGYRHKTELQEKPFVARR